MRAWAVALPAWLIVSGATALSDSSDSFGVRIMLALCGFLVAGLILIVARPLLRATDVRGRGVAAITIWMLAGALAALTTLILTDVAGLPSLDWHPAVLAGGAFLTVLWLPLGGRYENEVRNDAEVRSQLLRQLARERALAIESARLVEADRSRVVQQTQQIVSDQLHRAVDLSADPDAAAAALQVVVDDVVRPLSRELERGEVEELALVEAVHEMGQTSARPLRDFIPELLRPEPGTVVMTILRIAFAVFLVVLGAPTAPDRAAWLLLVVLAMYAIAMAGVLTLAIARTSSSEKDLSGAVESAEWASSRLRQLAWNERERLGKAIHGEAQARIVATALQIQLGKHDDVAARVEDLDREIHELLAVDDGDKDWRAVWCGILKVWEYSVEVDAAVSSAAADALDDDPVAAYAVVSVLREAVTNAIRHGHAQRLHLDLSLEQSDILRFTVDDDGRGRRGAGVPGLGSRTMDAACIDWHLITRPDGHTLIARIPVARNAHV